MLPPSFRYSIVIPIKGWESRLLFYIFAFILCQSAGFDAASDATRVSILIGLLKVRIFQIIADVMMLDHFCPTELQAYL